MEKPEGLFKVSVLGNEKINSTKKRGATKGNLTQVENSGSESNVDFNEYNCVGAQSSGKGGTGTELDSQELSK